MNESSVFLFRGRDEFETGLLQQVEAFPVGTVGGLCLYCSRAGQLPHRLLYIDNHSA